MYRLTLTIHARTDEQAREVIADFLPGVEVVAIEDCSKSPAESAHFQEQTFGEQCWNRRCVTIQGLGAPDAPYSALNNWSHSIQTPPGYGRLLHWRHDTDYEQLLRDLVEKSAWVVRMLGPVPDDLPEGPEAIREYAVRTGTHMATVATHVSNRAYLRAYSAAKEALGL